MGFLVKAMLVILVVAVAGGFVINHLPALKQRAIEVANPAVKEGRLLGELKVNLDELGDNIGDPNGLKDAATRAKLQKSKELLEKSKNLLNNLAETNQKNSGIIKQQIGKIIDAFTDRTPYPADHLSVNSASPSPTLTCPPR